MSRFTAARTRFRKLQARKAKFEIDLSTFRDNLWKIGQELPKEKRKIVLAGGAAYASSAAKNTPPDAGKNEISPVYYEDGVDYRSSSASRPHGRRRIYDLLALARNPATGHNRSLYGKLLRQGYTHVVSMHRPRGKLIRHYCRSLAEAKQYAHENYRGLYRASWGLGFKKIQKQPPPAFNKYAARRPDLRKTALKLNNFRYDTNTDTLSITNEAIPSGESFVKFMDTAASSAALKTMNKRIVALMKRKYDL